MVHNLKNSLVLPLSIITPIDIGRIIREVEDLKIYVEQVNLRKEDLKMPKFSRLLDNLVELNNLKLNNKSNLDDLLVNINNIKLKSPVVHVSFSVDPSVLFLERITAWFRQEIHPTLLLTIGLQPTIGAGLIVRTNNKYFDFSLRQQLVLARKNFVKIIEAV